MEKFNYKETVRKDIMDFISQNISLNDYAGRKEELAEFLTDELINRYMSDSVGREEAERNLEGNADLLETFCREYHAEDIIDDFRANPETADTAVRCYLLAEAVEEILADMEQGRKMQNEIRKKDIQIWVKHNNDYILNVPVQDLTEGSSGTFGGMIRERLNQTEEGRELMDMVQDGNFSVQIVTSSDNEPELTLSIGSRAISVPCSVQEVSVFKDILLDYQKEIEEIQRKSFDDYTILHEGRER